MDLDSIRVDTRLYVVEYFVASLCAMALVERAEDQAPTAFAILRDTMIAGCRARTYPQFDAAMSDLYSAELETAAAQLADLIDAQITGLLKSGKSKAGGKSGGKRKRRPS